MIDLYAEIRARYGNVRRARGYYLYTEKNIRILDLWLDGGAALLGRRAGQSNASFKHFLDRGLTGLFPTKADGQLLRALKALLPACPVIRWYAGSSKAEALVRKALHNEAHRTVYTTVRNEQQTAVHNEAYRIAHDDAAQNSTAPLLPVWRPFLAYGDESSVPCTDRIMLIPPAYPVPCGIIAAGSDFEKMLPPSDALFPPFAYSLARAFFDLARKIEAFRSLLPEQRDVPEQNGRISRFYVKKQRLAQNRRKEAEYLIPRVWRQNGWYLFPHSGEREYTALFFKALDAHLLISPDYYTPSLLPDCESYTELVHFLKSRDEL